MKKYLYLITFLLAVIIIPHLSLADSPSVWFPTQNYIKPVSNSWGLLVPGIATSTTGCLSVSASGWISASGSACGSSGGASPDWLKQTNYGVLNLTASTTIPYWAKDAIYASSTITASGALNVLSEATSTFGGPISMKGWNLSTSTVVCMAPEVCQFQADGVADDVASGISAD